MPSSRIFVSYACVGDEQGSAIGRQLVRDIRATGTEAVADHETISDEQFMPFLNQELPQCGHLIFVQTPAAMRSLRVQAAVTLALTLVERQQMRSVLRMIAAPVPGIESQPLLTALRTFDASVDYPRARDQLLLTLGLIQLSSEDSIAVSLPLSTPRPPQTGGKNGSNPPPQPSGPISRPSGPMPAPTVPGLTPRPSGPMPAPTVPGPMPRPSGPIFQPPSAPLSAPPMNAPAPVPPNYAPPPIATAPTPNKLWSKTQALFSRPLKTIQTTIKAPPGKGSVDAAQTVLVDRPLPINTTRRTILRWLGALGLLLLLALIVFLVIFLLHQHSAGLTPQHPTPTPHRPSR